MGVDFLYNNAFGRLLFRAIQGVGGFKIAAWYLHTGLSQGSIASYIKKNHIDMTPYEGQQYRSFAEFFGRKLEHYTFDKNPDVFISPCDGLVSIFPITEQMELKMKGSTYQISDLIPDPEIAGRYRDGLCLIHRLEASDYHHYCYVDDGIKGETHYIPGQLHSVQPIACLTVPVYRLNRRWWTLLETVHFGTVAQIEVGAMSVGGITHTQQTGSFSKGDEMGNFELAGSTIVLLLDAQTRHKLEICPKFTEAMYGAMEVRAKLGEGIGVLAR
jgi:phosphatidylserine decarboxylase